MFRTVRDRLLFMYVASCSAATMAILLGMLGMIISESLPAISKLGFRFLIDSRWLPASESFTGEFNILPCLAGSALVAGISVAIAGPIGVMTAIYLQYYARPSVAVAMNLVVQIMAGMPSVVIGLFGLTKFACWVSYFGLPGSGLLVGAMTLAVMIVPTVILISEAILGGRSSELYIAASSLGMKNETIVRKFILPVSRHGLFAGVLLSLSRALGETMVVMMVCGNVASFPNSLFSPVRTLTASIALEMPYAMNIHRCSLFVCALVLVGLTTIATFLAELLKRTQQPKQL